MGEQRMIKRKVAIIIFYDNNNFMIQDRRKISKWGEDYGFFGGAIENNENSEEAIKREIKEELNFEIKDFKLFKKDVKFIKEINGKVERNLFVSEIPDLNSIKEIEGKIKFISRNKIPDLKMVGGDLELLKEIKDYLNKIK